MLTLLCSKIHSGSLSPSPKCVQVVRYTTGFTEVGDGSITWCRANPNLGHWNWSPIVTYNQSTPKPTGRQTNFAPSPQVMPEQQSHYVKPIHAAMPLSEIQVWELNHKSQPIRLTHL